MKGLYSRIKGMGIFGKKEEVVIESDSEDEEFQADDEFENRKLRKQLRDLKSENRKTRKEPPKPWGKQERLIVLIVMSATILISGILFLISSKNLSFPNFQFPSNFHFQKINFDSFNIFKEETIEIKRED